MGRIIVTGGTGIVGRHTVNALLAMGREVHVLTRRPSAVAKGAHGHACDVLDTASLEPLLADLHGEILIHLAWTTTHGQFWTDPANDDWFEASKTMVRTFVRHGGRRIVGAGTCAEYDWHATALTHGSCHENETPLLPHTPYGEAKRRFHAWLAAQDVESAWGRLFFLYGAGEAPGRFVPYVIRSLLDDVPALCGSGRAIRDFMDTRDAGRAFAMLATGALQGAVNIASGKGVALADIATMIATRLERPNLLRLGARADPPDEPPRLVADVSRLHDALGFRPEIPLGQGLDDAISAWQKSSPGTNQH